MKLVTAHGFYALSLLLISTSSCKKKGEKETVENSTAAEAISDNTVTSVVTLGTTKVTAAPGALAVGSEISVSTASDPDSFTTAYGNAPKASTAVVISVKDANGDAVNALNGQLAINLGYSDAAGLVVDKLPDNLCVFGLDANNAKYVWRRSFIQVDTVTHTLRFATKVTGTFQATFCGTEQLDGFTETRIVPPAITDAAATVLEGSWTGPCVLHEPENNAYKKDQIVYAGDKASLVATFYLTSETCDPKFMYFMIRMDFDFALAGDAVQPVGAKKIDQTYQASYGTPYTVTIERSGSTIVADFADNFNKGKQCGFTDWVNGKERDVTGCPGWSFAEKGQTLYGIYQIDSSGHLCQGVDSNDPDSSSNDATRPTAVNSGADCLVRN